MPTMPKVAKLYFKACLKCGGDMYLDWDAYGAFRKCLQCGRMVDLAAMPVFAPVSADEPAEDQLAA